MLDPSRYTQLFDAQLDAPDIPVANGALILSGCRAALYPQWTISSSLEEENHCLLNSGEAGTTKLELSLHFENNFESPYFSFWFRCVSLSTDTGLRLRLAGYPTNYHGLRNHSKVDGCNKVILGLCLFLPEQAEPYLRDCHAFWMETYLAINASDDLYGVLLRVEQTNGQWILGESNTCRPTHRGTIDSLPW